MFKKVYKKLHIGLFTLILSSIVFTTVVSAQINIDIDNNIPLEKIEIPFLSGFALFSDDYTIFSWLSLIGGLATIGLVIFWIYLIIRTAIDAMRSQGTPEGLQEAAKKVRSIFFGMIVTFFFPAVLSIIGLVLGIGTIFRWPKMFSDCPNSADYSYYFEAYLGEDAETVLAGGEDYRVYEKHVDTICGIN